MLLYLVSLFHLIFKSACVCLGVTRNLLEQPFDLNSCQKCCFFFTFRPVGQPGANTGILAVEQLQHSVAVALSVSQSYTPIPMRCLVWQTQKIAVRYAGLQFVIPNN